MYHQVRRAALATYWGVMPLSRTIFGCVARAQREVLPLPLALYHAAREYPGGAEAIAAVWGRNATTLQHKLNPNAITHQVHPAELEEILQTTRDPRIMDSLCAAFGRAVWVDVSDLHDSASASTLLSGIASMYERTASLTLKTAANLEDGRIDQAELAELELLTLRMVQSVFGLLLRAQRAHVEGRTNG